ncbi:hypothetical protein [Oceanithermus sp.]|uniref:hypothetical protein n=1 Tax=Oceanithermus sp. TaxID=2268145 RepID=UPI0025795BC2|nr:hypothetical protein [Oceanithermus sp.]
MNALLERLRRRQPRWLHLEVRARGAPRIRLVLLLEPFETPLAFVLALAAWWNERRLGQRGGWRRLFEPSRLGLTELSPAEPLVEVKNRDAYVVIRVGGLL